MVNHTSSSSRWSSTLPCPCSRSIPFRNILLWLTAVPHHLRGRGDCRGGWRRSVLHGGTNQGEGLDITAVVLDIDIVFLFGVLLLIDHKSFICLNDLRYVFDSFYWEGFVVRMIILYWGSVLVSAICVIMYLKGAVFLNKKKSCSKR